MESCASKSTHRLKNSNICAKKKLATFSKLQFLFFFSPSSCVSRVGFVQRKKKRWGRIRVRVTEGDTKAERRTVGETSKAKSSILNQSPGTKKKKNFFFWVPVLRDNQQKVELVYRLQFVAAALNSHRQCSVRRTASRANSSPPCRSGICVPRSNPPLWGN